MRELRLVDRRDQKLAEGGTYVFVVLEAVLHVGALQRHVLQRLPHLVRRHPLGDLLRLAGAHLPELEHLAGDRELALVRQALLVLHLVGGRRPAARHAHLLQPANGVAHHLVVVRRHHLSGTKRENNGPNQCQRRINITKQSRLFETIA